MTRKRKSRQKAKLNGHSNGHTAPEDSTEVGPSAEAVAASVEVTPIAAAGSGMPETVLENLVVDALPEVSVETTETLVVEAVPETSVVEVVVPETPAVEEASPADSFPWPPVETPSTEASAPIEAAPIVTPSGERPFSFLAKLEEPGRNAIGWTEDHTRKLKRAKDTYDLGLQIDREVLHLCAGIQALHLGDFEVVAINFQSCGIAASQNRKG